MASGNEGLRGPDLLTASCCVPQATHPATHPAALLLPLPGRHIRSRKDSLPKDHWHPCSDLPRAACGSPSPLLPPLSPPYLPTHPPTDICHDSCLLQTFAKHASAQLKAAINSRWGSYNFFQGNFTAVANNFYGSGWAWVVLLPKTTKLDIMVTSIQGNPMMGNAPKKGRPILGLDLWGEPPWLEYLAQAAPAFGRCCCGRAQALCTLPN